MIFVGPKSCLFFNGRVGLTGSCDGPPEYGNFAGKCKVELIITVYNMIHYINYWSIYKYATGYVEKSVDSKVSVSKIMLYENRLKSD